MYIVKESILLRDSINDEQNRVFPRALIDGLAFFSSRGEKQKKAPAPFVFMLEQRRDLYKLSMRKKQRKKGPGRQTKPFFAITQEYVINNDE